MTAQRLNLTAAQARELREKGVVKIEKKIQCFDMKESDSKHFIEIAVRRLFADGPVWIAEPYHYGLSCARYPVEYVFSFEADHNDRYLKDTWTPAESMPRHGSRMNAHLTNTVEQVGGEWRLIQKVRLIDAAR